MGSTGPPGGSSGHCNQGHTYAGSKNEVCGGNDWDATQLEVWRPACTSCGEHDACNSITRVCVCAEGCVLSNPATCVPDPGYQTSCSGHGSCEPFTGACICENA